MAGSGSTRERRETEWRPIDRSIDRFLRSTTKPRPSRRRLSGLVLFLSRRRSATLIILRTTPRSSLFILSLSLSRPPLFLTRSRYPIFVPPRYSVVSLQRLHRRRNRLYRWTTRYRGRDSFFLRMKSVNKCARFNFLLFLFDLFQQKFLPFNLFDKIR